MLISDFARFRLYDMIEGTHSEFLLKELYKNVKLFWFIAGYQPQKISPQSPVNAKAVQRMARLHDRLKQIGYTGHALEVYLVRLLFCLFAEDTGIFERTQFTEFIEQQTREDGSDLAPQLAQLFDMLNTPEAARLKNLDDTLSRFPYINGKLFEERLPFASFDRDMRAALLYCCAIDWSGISPAIFGSLFQNIMDETPNARRNLGAHYTTEENILKLIGPLFLDELRTEFDKIHHTVKSRTQNLQAFHAKLAGLKFLDPACGCGNFLVIAYRELRKLELEVLRELHHSGQQALDIATIIQVDVDQFHGIEIEEFPVQIAQVALWLTDHQMNALVSEEFGQYFIRLPLKKSAHIVHGNALRLDWNSVIAAGECDYVMGNPPFIGHQWRSPEQVHDMERIWGNDGRFGRLDYVACWYRKATDYIAAHPVIRVAFVSTNSITQGEQVGVLWPDLLRRSVHIHFAHRTFQWSSESKGKAAVHCVIIGFGLHESIHKIIFEYADISDEPHAVPAKNINPYLVDGPNIILPSRTNPPPGLPRLMKGSQPTDGGYLIFTESERESLLKLEPQAKQWLRLYIGGEELINGSQRWCLWLKGITPNELKSMPHVMSRLNQVHEWRLTSATKSVREWASYPSLFTQDRQPKSSYLALPRVSSEKRNYIPIAYLDAEVIAHEKLLIIENATLYHFGILCSTMHNAWMRAVCGRLESRYSYAPSVYNNFPWPEPTDTQRQAIETAAQVVLDARTQFPNATLADLYDPLAMPPELVRAHQTLDRAVDAAYGKKSFASEAERVAFLFERYQTITSLLPAATTRKPGKKTAKQPDHDPLS